jgi:hypothetical protein
LPVVIVEEHDSYVLGKVFLLLTVSGGHGGSHFGGPVGAKRARELVIIAMHFIDFPQSVKSGIHGRDGPAGRNDP